LDLLHLNNTFSIKNGLLGVNRIIFLKLLKCFKTKNIDKIRAVWLISYFSHLIYFSILEWVGKVSFGKIILISFFQSIQFVWFFILFLILIFIFLSLYLVFFIANPDIKIEGRKAIFKGSFSNGFSRSLILKEKNKNKISEVFVYYFITFFIFLYRKITVSNGSSISLQYIFYHFFFKLDCSFGSCCFF
jgi:hypothetical protein